MVSWRVPALLPGALPGGAWRPKAYTSLMPLQNFHPAVAAWFQRTFDTPTEPQVRGWPAIQSGRHALIAAPTGSGKTLAAFLAAIDDLVRQGLDGSLDDATQVVYVSPLKALSNDVRKNLRLPLEGIACELLARGLSSPEIRTAVRSGDTPSSERQRMLRTPPHILVTTPESLYLLLTSDGGRAMLSTVRTVIVDEIHAVADDKRGSHLALTLERLEALVAGPLLRVGLSATQKPIDEVARFLVGQRHLDAQGCPDCEIIDAVGRRDMDLAVEMPGSPLEAVMAGEVWDEIYDRLAALVGEHRTTLIFVNTRRMAERIAKQLSKRLGERAVTSHHGSLAVEQRLDAETRLKEGSLSALVATASLELGIDIGAIDLVVQMGSPRSINTLLQRVGRASHHVGGIPKGRLFPLSRDELIECIAAIDAARRGELDRLVVPQKPLDILAQQIVACAAAEEWSEDELFDLVRAAYPFRDLSREEFDSTVDMLAEGFSTRRGQRGRYLHLDAVNHRIRGRRGARLAALTCGGAIPDAFEFKVVQEPQGIQVGTLDEDFAIESLPGDIFQLGNTSWRILRIETGTVRVEDARGQPPSLPFWLGEAPGRTKELSEAVSRLRAEVDARLGPIVHAPPGDDSVALENGDLGPTDNPGSALDPSAVRATIEWLRDEVGIGEVAAAAATEYLAASRVALASMPTRDNIVMERFFDEAGDMHLVVHSPFGMRVNRAWGLALRKVFCRTFNFELQAAASDDALILSLGPTHSFPLEEVFQYLQPGSVRDKLVQAFLDAPMFPIRWRWNATRSLAVKRWVGGKRLAPTLQRMDAEDLLAVIFPDSLACLENIQGAREIPDHPLIDQTIRDCLQEAMDFDEFKALLTEIADGKKTLIARDVREPSPLAYEIIAAKPYAFLDDAPLEERRTLAIQTRRLADPQSADDLSALDQGAIDRVRNEAWPGAESPDELHDALLLHGFVSETEGESWSDYFAALVRDQRATTAILGELDRPMQERCRVWIAAERLPQYDALLGPPGDRWEMVPEIVAPVRSTRREWSAEQALIEIIRGRLQALGPVTVPQIVDSLGVDTRRVDAALLGLEAEGFVFRGHFTPGLEVTEWCERRLLSRIHRYTLNRLRAEIEPVRARDFMRFLFAWQRVAPGEQAEGPASLAGLLGQLEGFEVPAGAWESEILPARLLQYDPVWLDTLCLSGRVAWGRLSPPGGGPRVSPRSGPIRSTPIALVTRPNLDLWEALAPGANPPDLELSSAARLTHAALHRDGASFFGDLARATRLLDSQLEDALGELAAWGLVTADSFTGLRALLVPSSRRRPGKGAKRRGRTAIFGMENAGRWSLVRASSDGLLEGDAERVDAPASGGRVPENGRQLASNVVEAAAEIYLRRYGLVFRRLLTREATAPPWRDLVRVYRRMEARGEIRGGRFVAGFQGEQFALPEAVGRLRKIRRQKDEALISLSGADPLNLVGIVTPGSRVAALTDNRVLYRAGIPVAVREAGEVRFLVDEEPDVRWQLQRALVRRSVPPQLRAYLGRPA